MDGHHLYAQSGSFSTSPWNIHQSSGQPQAGSRRKNSLMLNEDPGSSSAPSDAAKASSQDEGNYLPPLLLEALGGGRRPMTSSKSPHKYPGSSSTPGRRSSPFESPSGLQQSGGQGQRKISSGSYASGSPFAGGMATSLGSYPPMTAPFDDDGPPPSQSLFLMNPSDMKPVESIYPSLPPETSTARTPLSMSRSGGSSASSSRNASGSYAPGSPMDLDSFTRGSPLMNAHPPLSSQPLTFTPSSGPSGLHMSTNNTPLKAQTTVTLIGFPPSKWRQVLDFAKTMDSVVSFRKSDDENGNWMVLTFASIKGVSKMKEFDGQLCDGSWFLTVKLGDVASSLLPSKSALHLTQLHPSTSSEPKGLSLASSPSPAPAVSSPGITRPKVSLSINTTSPSTGQIKSSMITEPQKTKPLSLLNQPISSSNSSTNNNFWSFQNGKSSTSMMHGMEQEDDDDVRPSMWHKVMDVLFGW